jgi:2,3-bisphosphoglycerate-independent phosphoglycerate mutase
MGWARVDVPGATGYLDTDYAAKGRYAIEKLKDFDIVCVHVEAPDEASHEGRADEKVKALEQIDQHIVGPVLAELQKYPDWKILVEPDHRTTLASRAHSYGAVPFAIAGSGVSPDDSRTYDEVSAAASGMVFDPGYQLMRWFLK